jgi:hypothetical protein
VVELRPYSPPSLWTSHGAYAKRRQLERKGFPTDLRGWRFVTLTLDPKKYPDPCLGWMLGKRHLRQFVYLLRKRYGVKRWCWKLEFHEPDEHTGHVYPHWHLLFDFKAKIDKDEISALWGKGRTNIKRVDNEDFDYLFKYAFKALDSAPDWILDRTCVRLFQTSRGFFPPTPVGSVDEEKESEPSPRQMGSDQAHETKNSRISDETIGERLKRWSRYTVSRSLSDDGKVRHRVHFMACGSWGQLLVILARIKITTGIPRWRLHVTENLIQTSCLTSLQRYLPASI